MHLRRVNQVAVGKKYVNVKCNTNCAGKFFVFEMFLLSLYGASALHLLVLHELNLHVVNMRSNVRVDIVIFI